MTIEEMHWHWRLLYNKINSNHKKGFSPAEIDAILNRAINEYVEMFYSGNNAKRYKIGFEVTQQRIDMLSTLLVSELEQPPLTPDSVKDGVYEFKLDKLKHPYKHFVRAYVTSPQCGSKKLNVAIEQSGDIDTVLCDENRKPSLLWKRAVGRIMKDSTSQTSSLYVYTNGEFDISSLQLEYLKIPAKVSLGTYPSLPTASNPSPGLKARQDSDLPQDYHDVVMDIAIEETSRILEDINRLNLRNDRLTTVGH